MNNTKKYAYTEIFELLEIIGNNYKNKLPVKVYKFFEENKLEKYNKSEIVSKIKRKELSDEALNIFAFLNLKYFCEDELEKNMLKQIYAKNNKDYNYIINEEKDYEIFKNKTNNIETNNKIIELPKENLIRKIFKWIKKYLKKLT